MRIGQQVYFREKGILKQGFVSKEVGNEDIMIICEDISYVRKYWEIRKVADEKQA
jgi:hypothetical protein